MAMSTPRSPPPAASPDPTPAAPPADRALVLAHARQVMHDLTRDLVAAGAPLDEVPLRLPARGAPPDATPDPRSLRERLLHAWTGPLAEVCGRGQIVMYTTGGADHAFLHRGGYDYYLQAFQALVRSERGDLGLMQGQLEVHQSGGAYGMQSPTWAPAQRLRDFRARADTQLRMLGVFTPALDSLSAGALDVLLQALTQYRAHLDHEQAARARAEQGQLAALHARLRQHPGQPLDATSAPVPAPDPLAPPRAPTAGRSR